MLKPVQITVRGMAPSEALSEDIRQHAAQLQRFFEDVLSCRVVVDLRHRHHRKGRHFLVRVELAVPGRELVAGEEEHDHPRTEDPYTAVADAFRAARRLLQDHARRHRHEVKAHTRLGDDVERAPLSGV